MKKNKMNKYDNELLSKESGSNDYGDLPHMMFELWQLQGDRFKKFIELLEDLKNDKINKNEH